MHASVQTLCPRPFPAPTGFPTLDLDLFCPRFSSAGSALRAGADPGVRITVNKPDSYLGRGGRPSSRCLVARKPVSFTSGQRTPAVGAAEAVAGLGRPSGLAVSGVQWQGSGSTCPGAPERSGGWQRQVPSHQGAARRCSCPIGWPLSCGHSWLPGGRDAACVAGLRPDSQTQDQRALLSMKSTSTSSISTF